MLNPTQQLSPCYRHNLRNTHQGRPCMQQRSAEIGIMYISWRCCVPPVVHLHQAESSSRVSRNSPPPNRRPSKTSSMHGSETVDPLSSRAPPTGVTGVRTQNRKGSTAAAVATAVHAVAPPAAKYRKRFRHSAIGMRMNLTTERCLLEQKGARTCTQGSHTLFIFKEFPPSHEQPCQASADLCRNTAVHLFACHPRQSFSETTDRCIMEGKNHRALAGGAMQAG